MKANQRKVVVIGAGSVGTTYIYALLQTGLADEIAIVDIDENRVEGEVMDLSHGLPFVPPVKVKAGDYSDCSDAQMIVVTAGAKQQVGQSRTELIQKNASIVKAICGEIKSHNGQAVLVMVTNPVDTLAQLALHYLGWSPSRVMGSGTVLDTARLMYMLGKHCDIDARSVHAYVIGEHGDSEVTPWSMAHIAGVPVTQYCETCRGCNAEEYHAQIAERVRDSAYHIIDYKGATFYGIGMSLARISSAVLRNEKSVLTVSTMLDGQYDIEGVCLGVPCVVGENGVERIIEGQLTTAEHAALKNSAQKVREIYAGIEK